eukprot:scaffold21.g2188.t1
MALLDAGATVAGKTIMDELAYSLNGENCHYGTPVNPAAPGRVPGGSSAGSAAAVAAGDADIGLGGDTGGSVRVPASYCGILGIRWFARDTGVLRRVGDVLLDPATRQPAPLRRWLVGADAFAQADDATSSALHAALVARVQRASELLSQPQEVEVGGVEGGLGRWLDVFRAYEAWQVHGAWVTAAQPAFGLGIKERFQMAAAITPQQFAEAAAARHAIRAHLAGLLGTDGVLAVSLPVAQVDGCPVGLGLVGPPGSDEELLALAERLMVVLATDAAMAGSAPARQRLLRPLLGLLGLVLATLLTHGLHTHARTAIPVVGADHAAAEPAHRAAAHEGARSAERELAQLRSQQQCQSWEAANRAGEVQGETWRALDQLWAQVQAATGSVGAGMRAANASEEEAARLIELLALSTGWQGGLCGAALRTPKIALLFLVRGPLPHAQLWERWLSGAVGLLPLRPAAALGCTRLHTAFVRRVCDADHGGAGAGSAGDGGVYSRQHLFTIYVHSQPDYVDTSPPGSIFHDRTVGCRMPTSWGSHSTIDAVRQMTRQALEDPQNQRFVLLSESDAPLYPAPLVWLQLMAERHSRVRACDTDPAWVDAHRASFRMFEGSALAATEWRKSSQWFALTREHAQARRRRGSPQLGGGAARVAGTALFVDDVVVDAIFRRHCYVGWDPYERRHRFCLSDEHMLPTLLAARGGLRNASDLYLTPGSVTYALWRGGEAHPHAFGPADVSPGLLEQMRSADLCRPGTPAAALSTYEPLFVPAAEWTADKCARIAATNDTSFGFKRMPEGKCYLFGRKFPPETADALLVLADRECGAGAAADGGAIPFLGQRACGRKSQL